MRALTLLLTLVTTQISDMSGTRKAKRVAIFLLKESEL